MRKKGEIINFSPFLKKKSARLNSKVLNCSKTSTLYRHATRVKNPGGHIVLGGDNVSPLVEIGLTNLPKSGGRWRRLTPLPPPVPTVLYKIQ